MPSDLILPNLVSGKALDQTARAAFQVILISKFMQEFSLPFSIKELEKTTLTPALYVVATPIGNLLDVSLRALTVLNQVNLIVCEDSRVTNKLLSKFKIKKPFLIYNDQSNQEVRDKILALIKSGQTLALVSDAGTPLISDPGYKLVAFLLANTAQVIAVPGPSSVTAALSISGIASDRFLFAGFVPHSAEAKSKFFEELSGISASLIFFESAQRLSNTLKSMLAVFGNRNAAVVREISKIYEETKRDQLETLADYYNKNQVKGELVILISKATNKDKQIDLDLIDQEIKSGLKKMKPKELIALIANQYGLDKKSLYQRMLKILQDEK